MRLPVSLFLALRYMRSKRVFVSAVTVISVMGIMLGVAILIIVRSVMNGFDEMWQDKILSFNAHMTVSSPGSSMPDPEALMAQLRKVPGVKGAAPHVQGFVVLRHGDRVQPAQLRGADGRYEKSVSRVPEFICQGAFSVDDRDVVIGVDLARSLGLHVGEKLLVYSPDQFTRADEVSLPEELNVAGIFDLGMADFDGYYALCGIDCARELFRVEEGASSIQVMTGDPSPANVMAVSTDIEQRIGANYAVTRWMEENRQLFQALEVENNMMLILLVFIVIVASFVITSTLITMAIRKTREIGLLKAVGVSSPQVMLIFVWQGLISGVTGNVLGLGLGLTFLHYRGWVLDMLNRLTGCDLLPKALYHLGEIPARTSMHDVVLISVIVVIVSAIAGLIPAARAARFEPVKALRYE